MTKRDLTVATALLSASVVLSRVLGFAREVVIAQVLGAGPETDAYLAAFVVPDLINHFLAGGALSTALLPLFVRRSETSPDAAWRLVSQAITVAAAVLGVAMVVAWFATPSLIATWYDGFDAEQIALTTRLTRIILPGPLFFTVGALLNATEQARRRFVASAIMPLIYNACIIAGGLILGPSMGVDGFSWGVIAGALLGPLLVPLIAARDVARLAPAFDPRDPDLRRLAFLAAPVLFSSSLLFFDEWFGRRFASELGTGAITWLNNARRLMLLPASMVGQALSQAIFPFLAALSARREREELDRTLRGVFRAASALSVTAAAGLVATAPAVVTAVFVRGRYTADDADQTSTLLVVLALAVPAWTLYSIALRALQAAERNWLSSAIGGATLVPSYFVYSALSARFGTVGLAAATPICLTGAALVIVAAMARVLDVSPTAGVARGTLEGLIVGAAAAGASLALGHGLAAVVTVGPVFDAAARCVAFGAVAVAGLVAIPGPAGDAVRRRLRRAR
ncbi:MAG: murein biosynthesis integral membrane protein MurJ [Myxococcales bacterium]|nr:murein biosynthesis integral membrane protein MurJ [Myxococcales bacterium]